MLILLCPPVQRESEKASPMDVEGKIPERATNRPSAIFLQEGVGRTVDHSATHRKVIFSFEVTPEILE